MPELKLQEVYRRNEKFLAFVRVTEDGKMQFPSGKVTPFRGPWWSILMREEQFGPMLPGHLYGVLQAWEGGRYLYRPLGWTDMTEHPEVWEEMNAVCMEQAKRRANAALPQDRRAINDPKFWAHLERLGWENNYVPPKPKVQRTTLRF